MSPPSAALRGRMTVAALAAGAVVSATHTVVSTVPTSSPGVLAGPQPAAAPVLAAAVVPVVETGSDAPTALEQALAHDAIGGDQLRADTSTIPALDSRSEVDVANLTKAFDIGRELAAQAALLDAALAEGAAEATLLDDVAYVRPVVGRLTSTFGARWGTSHRGIDIANAIGTPIHAVTGGVVEESGPASGFGLWVVLRHADGNRSVYGHINRSLVEVGQQVAAGEQIAEVGNRGFSTGPHLHFEIWAADGTKIDPMGWLRDRGIGF